MVTQPESTKSWIRAQEARFQNSSYDLSYSKFPEAPHKSLPRPFSIIKIWLMMLVMTRHSKAPKSALTRPGDCHSSRVPTMHLQPPAGCHSPGPSSFLHQWQHMHLPLPWCSSVNSGKPFLPFSYTNPYLLRTPQVLVTHNPILVAQLSLLIESRPPSWREESPHEGGIRFSSCCTRHTAQPPGRWPF